MKRGFWFILLASAAALISSALFAAELPPTAVPENRDCDLFRHQVAEIEKGNTDLLWVGDSITDFWDNAGIDVWNRYYVDKGRNPLNFGISGDRTSQVIWRIDNAPMAKIAPKNTTRETESFFSTTGMKSMAGSSMMPMILTIPRISVFPTI